jgi:hypothetical protein
MPQGRFDVFASTISKNSSHSMQLNETGKDKTILLKKSIPSLSLLSFPRDHDELGAHWNGVGAVLGSRSKLTEFSTLQ